MITEADINQTRDKEKNIAESYLKGIMDFVKWTSTLATAAILWIGNTLTSTTGLSLSLAILGLLFLVLSLILAVLAIRKVLTSWAKEWRLAIEDSAFCLLKKLKAIDPSKVNEKKEKEHIVRLIKAIDDTKPFSEPSRFSPWISWHITFLILGLLLYIFAQGLGRI